MSLFKKVIMTNLLCLCFSSIIPSISHQIAIWKLLTYPWAMKTVFLLPNADPSNHTFRGGTLCTGIKKIIAIINLTKMIGVSGLFPHIFGINTFSLFPGLSIELRSSRLCIKHFYQVSHHLSPWLYRKWRKKILLRQALWDSIKLLINNIKTITK